MNKTRNWNAVRTIRFRFNRKCWMRNDQDGFSDRNTQTQWLAALSQWAVMLPKQMNWVINWTRFIWNVSYLRPIWKIDDFSWGNVLLFSTMPISPDVYDEFPLDVASQKRCSEVANYSLIWQTHSSPNELHAKCKSTIRNDSRNPDCLPHLQWIFLFIRFEKLCCWLTAINISPFSINFNCS